MGAHPGHRESDAIQEKGSGRERGEREREERVGEKERGSNQSSTVS
jgi:hypothetical protein